MLPVFMLAGCTTTRLLPVSDVVEASPFMVTLRSRKCDLTNERIFRTSLFENDQLLMIADVESGGSAAGIESAAATLILRGEAMDELFRVVVGPDLVPVPGSNLEWAGHPVKIDRSAVFVDGRRFPLGPGELVCLMGGRIPRHWLGAANLRWNPAEKSLHFDDGARMVSIEPAGEQPPRIKISWSSGWFSKSTIRVTMSFARPESDTVSGKVEAPWGYSLRWAEM